MKVIIGLLIFFLLTACASKPSDNYSDLYLRSEFTYWEAQKRFKFSSSNPDAILANKVLIADVVADGNPYHLKVADKLWSKDKNCGFKLNGSSKLILNQWLELECHYDYNLLKTTPVVNPIKFEPRVSGKYKFELKMSTNGPVALRVNQIKV